MCLLLLLSRAASAEVGGRRPHGLCEQGVRARHEANGGTNREASSANKLFTLHGSSTLLARTQWLE